MAKEAKGEVRWTSEGASARVTWKGKQRRTWALPTCRTEAEADERCALVAKLVQRLRRAKLLETDDAAKLLDLVASSPAALLPGVLQVADELVGGTLPPKPGTPITPTFGAVAKDWTDGRLHERYPDHVRAIRGGELNASRLAKIGAVDVGGMKLADVPIDRFTLEHAEQAMRRLPDEARRPLTRRAYAVLINRVLGLAVYPLRLIAANPLPKGFVPKMGKSPAYPWLYPDEDATLLVCRSVPLWRRMLWGVLTREGMRSSEARACRLGFEVNLERGTLTLDKNKTDDPRAWALGADVVRALATWCELRKVARGELVLTDDERQPINDAHLARLLRADLKAAGVDRPELHVRGENRGRMRAHDLRGTFVTLALADGRTETWVADRTGHKSSAMINRYRKAARTAAELGLGWLRPLDVAIPELAEHCPAIAPRATTRDDAPSTKRAENSGRRGPDSNRRVTVLQTVA